MADFLPTSSRHCKECNKPLTPKQKHNTYCSSSCSAIRSNRERPKESRLKQQATIKQFYVDNPILKRPKIEVEIVGPYTKVYLCTCKYTGTKWYSPTVKTICPNVKTTRGLYAKSCKFTFGIKNFPIWFNNASELINQYGWYATPGSNRKGINNITGISRDHMYSITDGWKNEVEPQIIRHPANCKLIQHTNSHGRKFNMFWAQDSNL